jgi:HK97 family phage major capsid protein
MVGSELLDYKTDTRKADRPLLTTDLPNIAPNQYLEYRKLLWQYLSGTISADQATDRRQRFFDNLTVVYPPAAGWLVLPVIATRIRQKEREMDPLLNYVNTLNVSTGDRYLEYVSFTNPEARMRESEFDAGMADPVIDYDKFEVPFNEIYKQVTLTRQAMDDIPMAERLLGDKAGVAIAYTEARQIVDGDGIIEPGDGIIEPRGILSYPDGTAYGEIPQVIVSAEYGELTYDGMIDFMYSLEAYALNRPDLRVFVNRAIIPALMKIKDNQDRPLWQPSLIQGQPSTFHGRAIEMSPTIPYDLQTDYTLIMIMGALSEAYTFVNRTNIRVFRNPYVAFPQTIIDVSKRIGGGVVMPNYVVIGKMGDVTAP